MRLPMDMQQQSPGACGLPGAVPVTPGNGAHACTPVQHLLARSAGMPLALCILRSQKSLYAHCAGRV